MNFKHELLLRIYGADILEALTLDMLLSSLTDGQPRPQSVFYDVSNSNISGFDAARKTDKLLEDGHIKAFGDSFIITSKGMLHLNKGGYKAEVVQSRRVTISFWLSILATCISIAAFVSRFFDF